MFDLGNSLTELLQLSLLKVVLLLCLHFFNSVGLRQSLVVFVASLQLLKLFNLYCKLLVFLLQGDHLGLKTSVFSALFCKVLARICGRGYFCLDIHHLFSQSLYFELQLLGFRALVL